MTIHWKNSENATSIRRIFNVSLGWHNTKSLIEVLSLTKGGGFFMQQVQICDQQQKLPNRS